LECPAIQDVLPATDGLNADRQLELKRTLHRIVAMLTRLISRLDTVAEAETSYITMDPTSPFVQPMILRCDA